MGIIENAMRVCASVNSSLLCKSFHRQMSFLLFVRTFWYRFPSFCSECVFLRVKSIGWLCSYHRRAITIPSFLTASVLGIFFLTSNSFVVRVCVVCVCGESRFPKCVASHYIKHHEIDVADATHKLHAHSGYVLGIVCPAILQREPEWRKRRRKLL